VEKAVAEATAKAEAAAKAEKMTAGKKTAGTALVEAAKDGNLSGITRLLACSDSNGFVNATDEDEENPMYRRATSVWWAARQGINVKTSDGNKFLEFAWAQFGTRAPIAHVAVVLCNPECADQELRNAEQLNQKVAIVQSGGNTFCEKAHRAQRAGALALIIINSQEELLVVARDNDSASPVTIPVVLVASDTGATLLHEGSHLTFVGCNTDILKALIGAGADVNLASQHRKPNLSTNVTPISAPRVGTLRPSLLLYRVKLIPTLQIKINASPYLSSLQEDIRRPLKHFFRVVPILTKWHVWTAFI
jgi:hypothetical protein